MKVRFVNWTVAYNSEEWEFSGAEAMFYDAEERQENGEDVNPDLAYDENIPILNFIYPLYSKSLSQEKILEVCSRTACTVIFDKMSDSYYLALTGAGMDFSQDIALAYIIADGCIDWDFLEEVYVDGPLSLSREDYEIVLKELKRQLAISICNRQDRLGRVVRALNIRE